MKKIIILILSLCSVNLMVAQAQAIKITHRTSQKEIIIKENKRIKIKTGDGQKISGRFSIEQPGAIFIHDERIELSDIEEIKRNPLLISLLTRGFFIYAGALTAGFGVIIGVLVDATGYLLLLPAAGMIYTGINPPNFNRNYKKEGNWTFELITTSP